MIATLTLEGNLISCRLDNLSSVSNDHCKFNELECLCCFFWLICHKNRMNGNCYLESDVFL